jgi:hypothetical protein
VFEARDVIGTMRYIRSRADLSAMAVGIFARCMGANATFRAVHTDPDVFADVRCLVAPLLLSPRAFLETGLQNAGLGGYADEVDHRYHLLTGGRLTDGRTSAWAPSVTMPTLTYGVHDDALTTPSDLEEAYAAISAADKDMFWSGSAAGWPASHPPSPPTSRSWASGCTWPSIPHHRLR